MDLFRRYYYVTKPGIIRGNLLTAIAGYVFGASGNIDVAELVALAVGVSCVIAAGCVWNNVLDVKIDSRMQRTKKRALVTGEISARNALVFGAVLAAVGFTFLALWTNILATAIGAFALGMYVVVYGYAKRKSVHGTLIGAIPGAAALVAGYVAAVGTFTTVAALLALVMIFWQMAHFYAIAIFRLQEYESAKIPVLPLVRGISVTRVHIIAYIILFALSVLTLSLVGATSYSFAISMGLLSAYWLYVAATAYTLKESAQWARKVFGVSLVVLLGLSGMLIIDNLLP